MSRILLFTLTLFLGGSEALAFRIESPAFSSQETLPSKYTCDGENLSPPLLWKDPPEGTQSLALISEDPDAPAGTWIHWVLYNIPPEPQELQEGIKKIESLPNGAKQGLTDFRRVGYGGPCPPPGLAHHYFFKLYALSVLLNLPPQATKADLLMAMSGHVLAHAEVVGVYQRKQRASP